VEPELSDPNVEAPEGLITRTVVYVVVALVIGFAGGIGYAQAFTGGGDTASDQAADPVAAAEPEPQLDGTQADAVQSEQVPQQPLVFDIDLTGRPSLGDPDSLVTVVEMTDYECPFCRLHHQQVMAVLLSEYGDRIRYVTINFPLSSIHPLAFTAALAAECAHNQGLFWQYNDALFATTESLVPDTLVAIAAGLGVEMEPFVQCVNSGATQGLVVRDIQDGQRFGVTGTPTFFINGKKLVGARAIDIFRQVIDAELAAAGG
jgi:protein-disulfide isomerase